MMRQTGWCLDYYHEKGYVIDYMQTPSYMFLLFKQPLTMWIDEEPVSVGADHCILYEPKIRKHYCGVQEGYYHDCMFFDGEEVGEFVRELGITLNKPFPVNDAKEISALIRDVAQESVQTQRHTAALVDLKLRLLFYKVADAVCVSGSESKQYFRQLSELRREVFVSPEKDWSVEYLAEQLHLSVSRFQHLYREQFSTTFKQDLIKNRMGYAKNLLRNSSRPVAEVAAECGYRNQEHFFRQFKKHTGITPRDYREEYGKVQI